MGGTAGVGGTLDVIVTSFKTKAYTGSNVKIYADGDVKISAKDEYDIIAAVATVGASGTAAVAITALVSVSMNAVDAHIGSNNIITGKSVEVIANSDRNVVSVVSTVSASGVAGVGVNLSVVFFTLLTLEYIPVKYLKSYSYTFTKSSYVPLFNINLSVSNIGVSI